MPLGDEDFVDPDDIEASPPPEAWSVGGSNCPMPIGLQGVFQPVMQAVDLKLHFQSGLGLPVGHHMEED